MKISQIPTKTIAIKAKTQSEWDSVDFVILHLDDQTIDLIKERISLLNKAAKSKNFHCMEFWSIPDGWYQDGMDDDVDTSCLNTLPSNWNFAYVDITDEEQEKFTKPEQTIDAEIMKINEDGNIWFVGCGKHTGEEFWTETISGKKLIEDYDSTKL